ncbi:MAG: NAD(P)H-hydrate dehydratase [Candidatus Krumholzibacteriota bacterium]|nr:NAD(P)H-hydrate dehydratase [Candidatus Krumholzibacteriota bacterium]
MYLVTSEEMRRLDSKTIERFEPGLVLMERAGQGVFDSVSAHFEDPSGECVSIFLGRGNNAGDGLVAGRLLAEAGVKVVLLYMHEPDKFTPDAAKNYSRLDKIRADGGIEEVFLYLSDRAQKALSAINKSTVIIDALLGTGINSPVRDEYAEVIDQINISGIPVVSVDIPSGINGTSGEVMGRAVAADLTVTMGFPKTGMAFYPGKSYCGVVDIIDIGIPREVIEESGLKDRILDIDLVLGELPERDPAAHKFDCGSLLVIAGSRSYSGAAYLSAVSALRSGCGIVYLAAPESIRTVIQSLAPEIIFISLPETGFGSISLEAAESIPRDLRYDAAVIGPGLTNGKETSGFVTRFVSGCKKPLLIDADGLNAFLRGFSDLAAYSKEREIILTPHSGELQRLTGSAPPASPAERTEYLRTLVEGTGITLIHKGAPTLIAHNSLDIDVNIHGHPGLATAGSGDVLAGAVGGILAQGVSAGSAARVGVYLHSRAADLAAQETGERSMIAGDCCNALPLAMIELEEDYPSAAYGE